MIRITPTSIFCVAAFCTCAIGAENPTPPSIAFSPEHDGGLYVLDVGSGKLREIDVGLPNIGDLAYSTRAKLLAFEGSRGHGQLQSLYLLELEDYEKDLIYEATSNETLYRPQFDPSGQYLYAVNYSTGIYRFTLTDRTWKRVQVSGVEKLNPQGVAFSKSGQQVAISPGNFQGFLIASVESNGFVVKDHVLAKFGSCISPQWIGDSAIVFAGRKEPGLQFIWKLDLESGTVTRITSPPLGVRDFLSLSRDERTIVFTGTAEKFEWRLWQVGIDGTGLRKLTKGGTLSGHLSPVWLE